MPSPATARPVSPLGRELAATACGYGTLALGGVVGAIASGGGPWRILTLWAVGSLVVGGAQAVRAGWLRTEPLAPVAAAARVESARDTGRRTGVVMLPALILLAVAGFAVGAGLAALVSGVLTGTALGDLRGRTLVRRREGADHISILRELGPHPFAGPHRPLYMRPRSENTLLT